MVCPDGAHTPPYPLASILTRVNAMDILRPLQPIPMPVNVVMPLAAVYLDGAQVPLGDVARPVVATIVMASGGRADWVRVVRLETATAMDGANLRMDDIIDRTGIASPIYLKCFSKVTTVGVGIQLQGRALPPRGSVITPPEFHPVIGAR